MSSFNSGSLFVTKTLIAFNANDVGGPNHLNRGKVEWEMERHFQNTRAIKFPWVELLVGTRLEIRCIMHGARYAWKLKAREEAFDAQTKWVSQT